MSDIIENKEDATLIFKEDNIDKNACIIFLNKKLFSLTYCNILFISEFIHQQITIKKAMYYQRFGNESGRRLYISIITFTGLEQCTLDCKCNGNCDEEEGLEACYITCSYSVEKIEKILHDFLFKERKSNLKFYIGEIIFRSTQL
jgi:hypothetical protein